MRRNLNLALTGCVFFGGTLNLSEFPFPPGIIFFFKIPELEEIHSSLTSPSALDPIRLFPLSVSHAVSVLVPVAETLQDPKGP